MYNNLPALTGSILWDERLLFADYAALSEDALRGALQEYLQAVNALRREWHAPDDSPLSLWISRHDQLSLYRPGLLSAERIILTDSLEEAALRLDSAGMATATDLLVQNRATDRLQDIRVGVAQFVRFVREHFHLIQAGFIVFSPCQSAREEQVRKLQLLEDNAARHFLSGVMPPAVVRLYERSLTIRGVERVSDEGHMRFVSEKNLPGEILLELRDCLSPYANGHIFQEIRPLSENEDGTLAVEITRSRPNSRSRYNRWIQGAANRSIYFHYRGLLTDLSQSAQAGASLVTRCPLQGKILAKLDAPGQLSRRMLEIDIPFLQNLSLADIFRIRTDYEPSVTAFRRSLRDAALEMEQASGAEAIRLLQLRFRERIADEGLEDLRQKLSAWKRQSMQDTVLLALPAVLGYTGAPAISTLATGAVSLLQAALGAYRNHREITRHPSWFLFRTSESKRLRR
ncbi:Uncharacterised protein [Raoultella terrigena]|uniref:Uncharacterized protein n=2 Tax=Raoultella terrigena TaxID=577 RepID=A0A4U9DAT0_RAOTE|nr:hypothetical protein [Raoultella terrigena]SUQ55409.1 Uncharacterised protein [Raoultella terrigena]VTN16865.1 Uncharacterised protein [Raoultella terrigena]